MPYGSWSDTEQRYLTGPGPGEWDDQQQRYVSGAYPSSSLNQFNWDPIGQQPALAQSIQISPTGTMVGATDWPTYPRENVDFSSPQQHLPVGHTPDGQAIFRSLRDFLSGGGQGIGVPAGAFTPDISPLELLKGVKNPFGLLPYIFGGPELYDTPGAFAYPLGPGMTPQGAKRRRGNRAMGQFR